ncbi:MAG: hypothetical protein CMJ40_00530 [Phycisphaerae bacterium]|nr:hypothetical protein [Phycisphaerae bacterium]
MIQYFFKLLSCRFNRLDGIPGCLGHASLERLHRVVVGGIALVVGSGRGQLLIVLCLSQF